MSTRTRRITMLLRRRHPATATVRDAIEYLASACDGAVRRDGHGFGADHVAAGRDLVAHAHWGPRRRRSAGQLVRIYRCQLARAGFNPSQILGAARPETTSRRRLRSMTPRWATDPTGLHRQRYWNGARWTQQVA
ncbi:MAG: DUF2510 domain-containing protein [Sulfitobacter sp.]|nr:DUF2510 domain-containing protein [Sulfitobacter sp.]